jgi:Rrf2 family protein
MIPMTAEYALRAVVVLGRTPGKACSADEIAQATRAPRRYVNKVLQALVRSGLVRSQPGPGGGYALLRPADAVSILDVVTAVEPIPRIRNCPLGLENHATLCPLHRQIDDACATIEAAFAAVTIAQLLRQGDAASPLCEPSKPSQKRSGRTPRTNEARR